jgi:hypothetical protein
MKGVFEFSGFRSAHDCRIVGLRPKVIAAVWQPGAAVVARHW